jgi:Fe/S biogenesis protein NfuA
MNKPAGSHQAANETKTQTPQDLIIQEQMQQLLDTEINPGVAMHGGMVLLRGVQDRDVYLQFGGGCHGCGQVDVTLKQGIETLIRERIPEVRQILDQTDHAAGENPYYQR